MNINQIINLGREEYIKNPQPRMSFFQVFIAGQLKHYIALAVNVIGDCPSGDYDSQIFLWYNTRKNDFSIDMDDFHMWFYNNPNIEKIKKIAEANNLDIDETYIRYYKNHLYDLLGYYK